MWVIRIITAWIVFAVCVWIIAGCEHSTSAQTTGKLNIDSALCFNKVDGHFIDHIDLYPQDTVVWRKYFVGTTKQICNGTYTNLSDSIITVTIQKCAIYNDYEILRYTFDTLYTKQYKVNIGEFEQTCETRDFISNYP